MHSYAHLRECVLYAVAVLTSTQIIYIMVLVTEYVCAVLNSKYHLACITVAIVSVVSQHFEHSEAITAYKTACTRSLLLKTSLISDGSSDHRQSATRWLHAYNVWSRSGIYAVLTCNNQNSSELCNGALACASHNSLRSTICLCAKLLQSYSSVRFLLIVELDSGSTTQCACQVTVAEESRGFGPR